MKLDIVVESGTKSLLFSELFKRLKTFSDTLVLTFNDTRLYIQGMDASHIVLFEVSINKEWFQQYQLDIPSVDICVDTNIVSKIMSVLEPSQCIHITHSSDNVDKLNIEFTVNDLSPEVNAPNETATPTADFTKQFEIPLIDIERDLMQIPETEYDATVHLEYKTLKRLVDNFMIFDANVVSFNFTQQHIKLGSTTIEADTIIEILPEQLELYEIVEDTEFENTFNLNYLHKMAQFSKISNMVQIQQSNELPMELKYMIDDTNSLTFHLAPNLDV